ERQADPARGCRSTDVPGRRGGTGGTDRPVSRPAHPPLPLPPHRLAYPDRAVRARARGTPPRRPDRPSLPRRQAPARPPSSATRRGALRGRRHNAPRLARSRHDLRPFPAVRPAGGDGARCTIEAMTSRLAGLTGATLETAPSVCQTCIWWQSRGNREPDKRKWIERAEGEWGAWGTVYRDDDGRVLGSMQYGPA